MKHTMKQMKKSKAMTVKMIYRMTTFSLVLMHKGSRNYDFFIFNLFAHSFHIYVIQHDYHTFFNKYNIRVEYLECINNLLSQQKSMATSTMTLTALIAICLTIQVAADMHCT